MVESVIKTDSLRFFLELAEISLRFALSAIFVILCKCLELNIRGRIALGLADGRGWKEEMTFPWSPPWPPFLLFFPNTGNYPFHHHNDNTKEENENETELQSIHHTQQIFEIHKSANHLTYLHIDLPISIRNNTSPLISCSWLISILDWLAYSKLKVKCRI